MKPVTPLAFAFDLIGVIFLLIFLRMGPPVTADPGVGWHLRTGQWILENQQIPHSDPFLSTTEGRYWVSNQWLSDIVLWKIFDWGSWDALAFFCFALPLLSMVFFQGRILAEYFFSRSEHADRIRWLVAIVLCFALGLYVAWVQWIVRPVIFSFALFSLLFYSMIVLDIENKSARRQFLLVVAVTFVAWANLHSAFPLGWLLLGCAFVEALWQRNPLSIRFFASALGLASLATLLNPYGIHLHLNVLELVGNNYFMNLNNEWKSPTLVNPIFYPLWGGIALLVLFSYRPQRLWIRLVGIVLMLLSLRAARYVPFFGLILPTLLASSFVTLSRVRDMTRRSFFPYITCAFAVLVTVRALTAELPSAKNFEPKLLHNVEDWKNVREACQRSEHQIFNHPDLGGLITFSLWPACRAMIDDRNELNGIDAYEQFFRISNAEVPADDFPGLLLLSCAAPLNSFSEQSPLYYKRSELLEGYCLFERQAASP